MFELIRTIQILRDTQEGVGVECCQSVAVSYLTFLALILEIKCLTAKLSFKSPKQFMIDILQV